MLWFPSNVKSAVYLTADLPSGGKKWWVGAEDAQGRLITAWSQRPDEPLTMAQLKSYNRFNALQAKINEKENKGYTQEAKWVPGTNVWIDVTQSTNGAPPMPLEVPYDPSRLETKIACIRLAGKAASPTEIVRLQLYKEAGFANTSVVRLDHYEHDHRDVVDYPAWQTVFATHQAAEEAIEKVIASRLNLGYIVEKKDLSQLFNATVREAIPLIIPGYESLIWDF